MVLLFNVAGDGTQWERQQWTTAAGVWQTHGRCGFGWGDLDFLNVDYDSGQTEFWENMLNPPAISINNFISIRKGPAVNKEYQWNIGGSLLSIISSSGHLYNIKGRHSPPIHSSLILHNKQRISH